MMTDPAAVPQHKLIGGGKPPSYEDDSIRSWPCGCYEDQGGYHFCANNHADPAPVPRGDPNCQHYCRTDYKQGDRDYWRCDNCSAWGETASESPAPADVPNENACPSCGRTLKFNEWNGNICPYCDAILAEQTPAAVPPREARDLVHLTETLLAKYRTLRDQRTPLDPPMTRWERRAKDCLLDWLAAVRDAAPASPDVLVTLRKVAEFIQSVDTSEWWEREKWALLQEIDAALEAERTPVEPDLERLARFCEQTARDGILPSLAWFAETARRLREAERTPVESAQTSEEIAATFREAGADEAHVLAVPRSCLHCEGHGTVREQINIAGDYRIHHCPNCHGTGCELPPVPQGGDIPKERT